ncbi:AMP deaminase 2 [Fasciola hepatica]|uniref:AMP deaminase 2 n=1 Tax=Fasciola hepatica TaxID=6192 RepID=A0A4E0RLA2_FASHE|nr:AMP deaminase 2 [Fasciola hepatica]
MDSPRRGLPGIIYHYDLMDSQLVELAENIKQRGRDGAYPLFKETGSEFVMPKFPIERKEMESHILELRMLKPTTSASEESRTAYLKSAEQYDSTNSLNIASSTMEGSEAKNIHEGSLLNGQYREPDGECELIPDNSKTFNEREPIKVSVSLPTCDVPSVFLPGSLKRTSGLGNFVRGGTMPKELKETSGESSVTKPSSGELDSEALTSSIWRLINVSASAGASGETAQVVTGPNTICPQMAEIDPLLSEEESAVEANIESAAVEFQRVQICGEDTLDVPVDELHTAAEALIQALLLRQKYMTFSSQHFHRTPGRYLGILSSGSLKLLDSQEKLFKTVLSPTFDHPINPPGTTGDPFALTYWPDQLQVKLEFRKGVMHVLLDSDDPNSQSLNGLGEPLEFVVPSLTAFFNDYEVIRSFVADGPLKSFCYRRLTYLGSKFLLHTLLNESRESLEQKRVSHRDFYNIRKVDTHLHAASCMNQKHLLRFIKKTIRTKADVLVCEDHVTKKPMTLQELIDKIGVTAYDLNIDNLDMHASAHNAFSSLLFDGFNVKDTRV